MQPLHRSFFGRSATVVARGLVGAHLRQGSVVVRITETEAYGPHDTACHAHRGPTPRTQVLFGPPGVLYVYRCYGIHNLLNVVAESDGVAGCVLIRAGVAVAGLDEIRRRRGGRLDLVGPGKLGQALGVDPSWTGRWVQDGLIWRAPAQPVPVRTVPRVGIDYAAPPDRDALWRFVEV